VSAEGLTDEGRLLLEGVAFFARRWPDIEPEEARDCFDDWADDLIDARLPLRELKALRSDGKAIARSCHKSDWYTDLLPVGTFAGPILTICGIVLTFNKGSVPLTGVISFIVLGLISLAAGLVISRRARRWKEAREAMRKFDDALGKCIDSARQQSKELILSAGEPAALASERRNGELEPSRPRIRIADRPITHDDEDEIQDDEEQSRTPSRRRGA
jgi:hypothetical protein